MSQHSSGMDRHGLDASFEADEALKSNRIVEAQMLSPPQQPDAAAHRFAQATEIEERMGSRCVEMGLREIRRVWAWRCGGRCGKRVR